LSFHTTGAVAAPLDFWGAGFAAKHAEAHAKESIAASCIFMACSFALPQGGCRPFCQRYDTISLMAAQSKWRVGNGE
jgi:hypothetical protein